MLLAVLLISEAIATSCHCFGANLVARDFVGFPEVILCSAMEGVGLGVCCQVFGGLLGSSAISCEEKENVFGRKRKVVLRSSIGTVREFDVGKGRL